MIRTEISETLGLNIDIQEPVSSGLGLKNCSYPSLSLDHQEFPSLGLKTETDFWESRSQKLRLTFKSLGLGLSFDNQEFSSVSLGLESWDWLSKVSKDETDFQKSWELRLSFKDISIKHDTILT